MITEITKSLDDFFSHDKMSSVFYEKEGKNIRKTYMIEYCDDEGKLERLGLLPEYGGLEIDDVYHAVNYKEDSQKTDTFDGLAIEMYLYYLFNPRICDVKMWEQIYEGDELLQERWFEMPSTFYHEFAKRVNKDITESRDNLRKQVEPLTKEIESFNQFLKEVNAEKTYKEWKEKRNENT